MSFDYLYIVFGKCLFRLAAHFSIRFLILYELFIYVNDNSLSDVSFANMFSHSAGCLIIMSMISFAVQKFLSKIRSHLFIFAFVSFP